MEERTDCVHALMGASRKWLYQVQPEASTIKAVDVGCLVAPQTMQEVSNGESFLKVQEVQDQDMNVRFWWYCCEARSEGFNGICSEIKC